MKLTPIYQTILESASDDVYKQYYLTKIRNGNSRLMDVVESATNNVFILSKDVNHTNDGQPNRCETNSYEYVKSKLLNGEGNYYPVAGFMFVNQSLHPIEHWWVYDKTANSFIDPTPMEGKPPICYAGVINFNINDEIAQSNQVFDVDFFKSGNHSKW